MPQGPYKHLCDTAQVAEHALDTVQAAEHAFGQSKRSGTCMRRLLACAHARTSGLAPVSVGSRLS